MEYPNPGVKSKSRAQSFAAEIPQKIRMLFQHHHVDAGARQQETKHHSRRTAAGNAAPHSHGHQIRILSLERIFVAADGVVRDARRAVLPVSVTAKHAKYFVASSLTCYGIKRIVLPPNFSQKSPLRRIYRHSSPLYKTKQ